jgi:hypothetical protein
MVAVIAAWHAERAAKKATGQRAGMAFNGLKSAPWRLETASR